MAQRIVDAHEEEQTSKKSKKERKVHEGYPNGIKKIASYSGVTRIMKCTNKCGKFDDIINLYVFPDGVVQDEYNNPENKIIDEYLGQNSINNKAVTHKDLTIWSKRGNIADRKKKLSKSVKRLVIHKHKNR